MGDWLDYMFKGDARYENMLYLDQFREHAEELDEFDPTDYDGKASSSLSSASKATSSAASSTKSSTTTASTASSTATASTATASTTASATTDASERPLKRSRQ
jgi:cytoskeletal protein RodZ